MKSELFNEEAMKELSSPEQLDEQVKLITNGSLTMFFAVILGLVAAVVWMFVGIISSGLEFKGVIFDHNKVQRLNSEMDAVISDVLVNEGDRISEGDVVAYLTDEETDQRIAELNALLKEAGKGSPEYDTIQAQISDYNRKMVIRSNADGVVQDVALQNDAVAKGDVVATVIPHSDYSYNEVYIYVPKDEAGAFSVGMPAQITPSYVSREEYGYIEGMISEISNTLVTENSIVRHMGNMDYVKELLPETSCVQITIQLGVASDGSGEYNWSNEKGRDLEIKSGDQCRVRILKKEYHPYELLLTN
ncbi:MAG: HlyD family efflux transporter periplasmic adaptor subunit [Lachnospiraceae bacterium]|nr:HlyD family efflux transporter periplasmic adaptor subunit [Lachnospiraceae bacterium]